MRKMRFKGRSGGANVVALTIAGVMLCYAFSQASPSVLASNAGAMLGSAASTVSAAVGENPYNTLARQLADKERELNEREAALEPARGDADLALYSLILGVILLGLVALNFYRDARRERTRVGAIVVSK